MTDLNFQTLTLRAQGPAHARVIGALRAGQTALIYFRHNTRHVPVAVSGPARLTGQGSIANAHILHLDQVDGDQVELIIDGQPYQIALDAPAPQMFLARHTIVAVRNGEACETVAEWLEYHRKHHGLEAALIVDRAAPDSDPGFLAGLEAGARMIEGLRQVTVLRADWPMGYDELGPEAHPYTVPTAPGKAMMEPPAPSPWDAPFAQLQIYEYLRHRFLSQARAVANIDVHDLIVPPADGIGIFERTVGSASGLIQLDGVQTFPWRVRNGQPIRYGDHICVQFDSNARRRRWCVAPMQIGTDTVWRLIRITGLDPSQIVPFYRAMALRHPSGNVSEIVPKASLIEDRALVDLSRDAFGHKPVMPPEEKVASVPKQSLGTRAIVTTMKNEGPFILEWLAYHRVVGFNRFLVYTNDCDDGTDQMMDLLQAKGYLQHRDNPFRELDLKPQHAALQSAESEPLIQTAEWVICMDVDEFVNIHAGDGTLDDLFRATGDANMISLTWRLFGNGDVAEFDPAPMIGQFTRCAPKMTRKPHQAWGFKTLYRNIGIFKKMGVHRPKGLRPQLKDQLNWVNGSGQVMPEGEYRNAWRSTNDTVGYDLVTLNHYAVRSAESFLVKRDRGRVNHVDRDQGMAYWFRMNHNADEDRSILRMLPRLEAEMAEILKDPEIAAMQDYCLRRHREKIDALRATENYSKFYADLTGDRLRKLSRLLHGFGANVFLSGPDAIPDEILEKDPAEPFYFTVEKVGETQH